MPDGVDKPNVSARNEADKTNKALAVAPLLALLTGSQRDASAPQACLGASFRQMRVA